MRTILLEEPGRFALADTKRPDGPAPGQALVRVLTVGVCGTDLHAFEGTQPFFSYPRILGHELAVEVVAVGDGVTGLEPGDRCAVNPYLTCGECAACRRGKTNCCPKMAVIGVHTDGGMREHILLPAAQLYPTRKLNPLEIALVETLGIGCHAVNRAGVEQGDRALVLGAGPIGLSVLEFLLIAGADAGIVEKRPNRLDFCRQNHGLERCYASHEEASKAEEPSTIVFDCTGDRESMESAMYRMAHGGKLIFVGLISGPISILDPDLHRRETTLMSSRNCTPPEHLRTIELLESGRISVKTWPSESIAPSDIGKYFPRWLSGEAPIVKGAIDFS